MEVIILENSEEVACQGSLLIARLMGRKPDAVLGLATGRTPIAMYQKLVEKHQKEKLSFRNISTFNLDEYLGVEESDPQSYRSYMNREFFNLVDIDLKNTHLPACALDENPRAVGPEYERAIASAGGIDMQVLGIGRNGHIGFNEPTSSLRSRTRVKTLTPQTLESNKKLFHDQEVQPELAITMGIATILDARSVILLATGEAKANAVKNTIEGPVSSMWPASALQMHEKVSVLLDPEAASELANREYYHWVYQQNQAIGAQFGDD